MDLQSLRARILAIILLFSCVAKIGHASAGAPVTRGGAFHQAHIPNYLRLLKDVLEATDPLTKKREALSTISFDSISADGKSIPLNMMFTEPEFRQNNLSSLLFHWFSFKRPQVRRMSLHFASTNLAEFNKFLIQKLRAHRRFDEAAYRQAQKKCPTLALLSTGIGSQLPRRI